MKLLRFFLRAISIVLPIALVAVLVRVYTPESLDDIAGRDTGLEAPVDLLEQVRSAVASGRVFECGEGAINQHVQTVLEGRESEGIDILAEFRGLWIRLREGGFDVVFEREVLGFRSTVSAQLRIVRDEAGYRIEARGGKFGRLSVPPGFLRLIGEGLANAGRVFEPEKEVLSLSSGLTITAGRLRLDPHQGAGSR